MRTLRSGNAHWWIVSLAVVAACGSGRDLPPAPGGDSSRTSDAAGHSPSGDASAGAGGEQSVAASGGTALGGAELGGDASTAASAGVPFGAAGAPSAEPIDGVCTGDRAFAVSGGAFVAPTEKGLALALNEDIFGASPITFVLRGGDAPKVMASYTIDDGGRQAFPASLVPAPAAAWMRSGGFGTETAQTGGYLLVVAPDGSVEVPLENVTFSVTTQERCTRGVARLAATIPASRRDLVDKLSGAAIGDPDNPGRGPDVETPLHAVFEVELSDFDFGSAP